MTARDLVLLFNFDEWATARTLESVSSATEEEYLRDLHSSHGGIHGTIVHIYSSNMIWLQRWEGNSPLAHVGTKDVPNLEAVGNHLREYWKRVGSFLKSLDDSSVNNQVSYNDLMGNQQSQPLFQQMQHLVNHSSYHRGQVVTMLRQIGRQPIGTDLITFYRAKGNQS
jgi:uncharacterized damage-inducible protein DinB